MTVTPSGNDPEWQEFLAQLTALLETNEGNIPFIYPDSDGNPTVGVGHLLINANVAASLPFRLSNGFRASFNQIILAWNFVKTQRRPYKSLQLDTQTRSDLLIGDIAKARAVFEQTFPNQKTIPVKAKLALYDMVFNLGSLRGFPNLVRAVEQGNWKIAAQECLRYTKASDGTVHHLTDRNAVTQALFLSPENFTAAVTQA